MIINIEIEIFFMNKIQRFNFNIYSMIFYTVLNDIKSIYYQN